MAAMMMYGDCDDIKLIVFIVTEQDWKLHVNIEGHALIASDWVWFNTGGTLEDSVREFSVVVSRGSCGRHANVVERSLEFLL